MMIRIIAIKVGIFVLLTMQIALAYETHEGRIKLTHYNADVLNRGACIMMEPALPQTGWACVWRDNPLYKEITSKIETVRLTGETCRVCWNSEREGLWEIKILHCPAI